jgi:hypothetical protein
VSLLPGRVKVKLTKHEDSGENFARTTMLLSERRMNMDGNR